MTEINKTLVITGGTKGIGKSIIELFASHHFNIITCARKTGDLEQLKDEMNTRFPQIEFKYLKSDLSQKQDITNFIEFIKKEEKGIDILVNNAGVFIPGQVHTEEDGALEKMIETNLYSAYHLTRGVIDNIKNQKGHIFNICSTASITPYINGGSYCISKFALLGFSKVLREEMKEFGVRVTSILPGATYTASWEGVDIPEERFMKAEDVAKVIFASFTLSENAVVEEILLRPQLGDL